MNMFPPRAECLSKATDAVMERAESYGPPAELFAEIAARWSITLRRRLHETEVISETDVALMMIDLKIARATAGGDSDTWVDIAGYAACGYEIDAKRGG